MEKSARLYISGIWFIKKIKAPIVCAFYLLSITLNLKPKELNAD